MMADKKDIDRLGRKLYLWSFGIALLFVVCAMLLMQAIVYRFSGGLLLRNLANIVGMGTFLFAAGTLYAKRRFRAVKSQWVEFYDCERAAKKGAIAEGLQQAIERYPFRISVLFFALVALITLESGFLWYFTGEVIWAISWNYMIMGLAMGLAAAFLEYFVLHRFLKPLREVAYPCLRRGTRLKGVTVKGRIVAMAVLLTIIFIMLGWTTAEVYNIHQIRDQMLEKSALHARLVGDSFDDMLAAQVSYNAQENLVEVMRLYDDEYVELLEEDGTVTSEFAIGDMDPSSINAEFLKEVRQAAVSQQYAAGSLTDRSGGLIASYAPTGFYGTRILTIVPLTPFLGEAMKIGYTFLFLSLLVAMISAIMAWLTVQSFSPPLDSLVKVAGEVSMGDLTAEVRIEAADEIGKLSLALRDMLGNLKDMIEGSKETALLVMAEAAKTQRIVGTSRESLEQVKAMTENFRENAGFESRRLGKITEMASRITAAVEAQINKRPGMWIDAGLVEEEPPDRDVLRSRLENRFFGDPEPQGSLIRVGTGLTQINHLHATSPGYLEEEPSLSGSGSLREIMKRYSAYERVLDFTISAYNLRRMTEVAGQASEDAARVVRDYFLDRDNGEEPDAKLSRWERERDEVAAKLLQSLELSRDLSLLMRGVMDYIPLVMQVVYEVNAITQANSELAGRLSESLAEHLGSNELLAQSCQSLAESAIQLQVQTGRFKTADR